MEDHHLKKQLSKSKIIAEHMPAGNLHGSGAIGPSPGLNRKIFLE